GGMSAGTTGRQLADGTGTILPVLSVILPMATGAQYMPRAATVAYAAAMDSGETLTDPSVNEGMLSAESCPWSRLSSDVPSALVSPMLSAVFTTLQRPTCFSSRAKYTLT